MKLLKKEYQELINLVEKHKLNEQYEVVKKKGWVYINIVKKSFAFHRKTSSKIINGKFVNKNVYYVNTGNGKQQVEDFVDMLTKFDEWLSKEFKYD